MEIKISPSIMCCKTSEIDDYIRAFEAKNIDSIHYDVMDGHYVDNVMMGTNFYRDLCEKTKLPIDLHLMTDRPERFLDIFQPRKGDRVCFHSETARNPYKLLQDIRGFGCQAGLVLNPGSTMEILSEVADQLDYVLLMTVNPGFAGQKVVPNAFEKIERIRAILDSIKPEVEVFVDGNTTFNNAKKMYWAGATGIIVGTSSLLSSSRDFSSKHDEYVSFITID